MWDSMECKTPFFGSLLYVYTVRTQDETIGLTLLWAHNLFMWALDFLLRVILA